MKPRNVGGVGHRSSQLKKELKSLYRMRRMEKRAKETKERAGSTRY